MLAYLTLMIPRLKNERKLSKENLLLLFTGQKKVGHQTWKHGFIASSFYIFLFVLVVFSLFVTFGFANKKISRSLAPPVSIKKLSSFYYMFIVCLSSKVTRYRKLLNLRGPKPS
jgi:hypothetical protein